MQKGQAGQGSSKHSDCSASDPLGKAQKQTPWLAKCCYYREHNWPYQTTPSNLAVFYIPFFNPFRTAVPFFGQTAYNLRGLSPKRDCCSKRVNVWCRDRTGIIFPARVEYWNYTCNYKLVRAGRYYLFFRGLVLFLFCSQVFKLCSSCLPGGYVRTACRTSGYYGRPQQIWPNSIINTWVVKKGYIYTGRLLCLP